MNKVIIIGRLTQKPELKATQNGTSVCSFTVAVERKFKDSDGNTVTDFVDCVAWKHTAEFLGKWFDKGVRVAISGELQTRFYTDKETEKKIKVCEVLVSDVEFADGKTQAKTTEFNTNTTDNATVGTDTDGFLPLGDDENLPWGN